MAHLKSEPKGDQRQKEGREKTGQVDEGESSRIDDGRLGYHDKWRKKDRQKKWSTFEKKEKGIYAESSHR